MESSAMPEVSLTTHCPEADAPFCVVRNFWAWKPTTLLKTMASLALPVAAKQRIAGNGKTCSALRGGFFQKATHYLSD